MLLLSMVILFFGLVGLAGGAVLAFVASPGQLVLWALLLGVASLAHLTHTGVPLGRALLCAIGLFACMQGGYALGVGLRALAESRLGLKRASGSGAVRPGMARTESASLSNSPVPSPHAADAAAHDPRQSIVPPTHSSGYSGNGPR
jgi:hypothetical protein